MSLTVGLRERRPGEVNGRLGGELLCPHAGRERWRGEPPGLTERCERRGLAVLRTLPAGNTGESSPAACGVEKSGWLTPRCETLDMLEGARCSGVARACMLGGLFGPPVRAATVDAALICDRSSADPKKMSRHTLGFSASLSRTRTFATGSPFWRRCHLERSFSGTRFLSGIETAPQVGCRAAMTLWCMAQTSRHASLSSSRALSRKRAWKYGSVDIRRTDVFCSSTTPLKVSTRRRMT
mmetsp:Transcript_57063/g.139991  ORF Transcript_57063/g.139991 Transcript_57063/m.139991 type:complete len:239 (-) Transcript_57063:289-1005(-)